jgi:hypothetical protein
MGNVLKLKPPKKYPLKEREPFDLHETPAVAVKTLLQVEDIPRRVWECFAGKGAVSKILIEAGHDVLSTDLHDHGFEGCQSGRDFFAESRMPDGIDTIISNCPYEANAGERYVRHALRLRPRLLILLLPFSFLAAKSRADLVLSLSRVHIFAPRLPTMHRDGWTGPRASSSKDHCWITWDDHHRGDHCINPVDWRQLGQAP